MKTFNCTQCGASIEHLKVNYRWTSCSYCKAKFLIPEEKRPVAAGLSFGVIHASDPDSDGWDIGPLGMAALIVFLFGLIVFAGVAAQQQILADEEAARADNVRSSQRIEENRVTNVPVTAEFDGGANDVLHYELPAIDTMAFSLARRMDRADDRTKLVVAVKVKTDAEGNVVEAEAVTGSGMLRMLSEKAARKTRFAASTRRRSRTISYTFG